MSYERGAVLWSTDPFKDDPDAGRPWLVIGNERQPFRTNQLITVALSTSGHDAAIPVDEDVWVEGSVPHQSTHCRGQSTPFNIPT